MPAKIQIQKQREILLFLIKILSFENFFLFLDLYIIDVVVSS
ncbi:hypothetical protein HMPREF2534_01855 [Bacteroides thetaiotaomicron]|nr:hypothetical protein HMPREF2534_01855 [Bacteroides thetaiotaomicron]